MPGHPPPRGGRESVGYISLFTGNLLNHDPVFTHSCSLSFGREYWRVCDDGCRAVACGHRLWRVDAVARGVRNGVGFWVLLLYPRVDIVGGGKCAAPDRVFDDAPTLAPRDPVGSGLGAVMLCHILYGVCSNLMIRKTQI